MTQAILLPLLLLALVGGYFFVVKWECTRYSTARQDGHRLYFRCAGYGAYVALATFILIFTARWISVILASRYSLPLVNEFSRLSLGNLLVFALLISPVSGNFFARVLNLFTDASRYFDRAIQENELESLVLNAISGNQLIMITLDDGKVYVGFPMRTSDPSKRERKYIPLIPVMSGQRDKHGRVNFTTFYDEVISSTEEDLDHLDPDDFLIVLRVSTITSLRKFDPGAYAKFLEGSPSLSVPARGTSLNEGHGDGD